MGKIEIDQWLNDEVEAHAQLMFERMAPGCIVESWVDYGLFCARVVGPNDVWPDISDSTLTFREVLMDYLEVSDG